jgi:dTDP-glucose 4,6-dehydratase
LSRRLDGGEQRAESAALPPPERKLSRRLDGGEQRAESAALPTPERKSRKRVLVTGGAGFISSNFIRYLLDATPYEVVTLDALTYAGNLENLADLISHPRLSFVHGDIRDASLIRELTEGVDVIVNAAAESHVEKSIEHGASEFVTTNVEGTQILLDAIRVTPVERFILISSSEVYGTAEAAPMDEQHALNPRSPYAATKAGADRLAYSYWTTYGLPIVIVRPFNNYGPRQHPEKVVPRFITQALADEPLTVHGDGHASRDWLYVIDDAEAIEAVIETPIDRIAGEVLNVATGIDIPVAEIARLVLEVLGKPSDLVCHVPERLGQVDRHIGSTEKAERLLGWAARTSFEDGLERTVDWYRDNEAWWRAILAREARAFSS